MKSEQIGARLKLWREHMDVTQAKFAEMTGVKIGALKKYEQGKSVPGGEALAEISKTGVNINWLLTGESEMIGGNFIEQAPKELGDYGKKLQQIFDVLKQLDPQKREKALNEMIARAEDVARMNELERIVKNLQNES